MQSIFLESKEWSTTPWSLAAILILSMLATPCVYADDTTTGIMTVEDLGSLMSGVPGKKISYGKDPLQFGELQIPKGSGPFPVVMFIHGGCWLAKYDIQSTRPLALAFKKAGFAVWNLEYRRVGNVGGGYPNTLLDVGAGADYLRVLSKEHPLDLARLVVMGHSAGGHLALWMAARAKIPQGHDLYQRDPIPVRGVVGLAPASDLTYLHEGKQCDHIAQRLMEGSPSEVPERYKFTDTATMAPIGVPQTLILGIHDTIWTPVGKSYIARARAAGDTQITPITAPDSGHFEMIDPDSSTFALVIDALKSMTDGE